MKQIFAISIIISLLGISSQQFLIYSSFKIDQDFIIENFCENKDKPEMKCNGKCHLKKKFAEAEDDKSEESKISENVKLEIIDHVFNLISIEYTPPRVLKKIFPYQLLAYSDGVIQGVFHPPRM